MKWYVMIHYKNANSLLSAWGNNLPGGHCINVKVNGMSYMELSDEECIEMIDYDKNDEGSGKSYFFFSYIVFINSFEFL